MSSIRKIPFLFFPLLVFSQQGQSKRTDHVAVDFSLGFLGDSNNGFPNHDVQKNLFLSYGKQHAASEREWAYYLNEPTVGVSFGFSDLGNRRELGYVYSFLPYADFSLFPSKSDRFSISTAFGGSYMDRIYDSTSNPNNKAVSTRLNWTFKSIFQYKMLRKNRLDWRIGLGYLHHSNGHVRKPNRGYNSILLGISGAFRTSASLPNYKNMDIKYAESSNWFYTLRLGIGQNSFSDVFNSKKEVFAGALSVGKIVNKTFKFGGGFYYRFYEHYYDYIVNQETLVRTQNPEFIDAPVWSASNLGVFGSAEVVFGHFGMELNIGVNIHKPFYKIDWQLNEGYTTFSDEEENIVLGDLGTYYRIKQYVSGRMGLKYYLFDLERSKNNVFIGAFMNSNLGQADFSEITIGYVRQFGF